MKLAVIGFGVVGQGLAEVIRDKYAYLSRNYGLEPQIVAVCDLLKGAVYHPDGLDIPALLEAVQTTGKLAAYPEKTGLIRDWDALTTIRQSNADVMVEVTYTDLKTAEPALSHFWAALEAGKHIATTNKGPIALAYRALRDAARTRGLSLEFEGTVMSGTPLIRVGMEQLAGTNIYEVRGILNGTTNYILTEMEHGLPYADALKQAQQLGYAEADPTADVEGFDTVSKLLILANTVMGAELTADQINRQGITHLTSADVQTAWAGGERWKLIGSVKREGDQITASVQPVKLPLSNPLAGVSSATNALTYRTDLVGDVTIVGAGAGKRETGFALLSDLLAIHRRPPRL